MRGEIHQNKSLLRFIASTLYSCHESY